MSGVQYHQNPQEAPTDEQVHCEFCTKSVDAGYVADLLPSGAVSPSEEYFNGMEVEAPLRPPGHFQHKPCNSSPVGLQDSSFWPNQVVLVPIASPMHCLLLPTIAAPVVSYSTPAAVPEPPWRPLANQSSLSQPGVAAALACFSRVQGHVWELSQDSSGCWDVQKAIEEATHLPEKLKEEILFSILVEMRGQICRAMQDPRANFVLQRLVESSGPSCLRVVADEVAVEDGDQIRQLAQHKYACRVLEKMFGRCQCQKMGDYVRGIATILVRDLEILAVDRYGNYVARCLLEIPQIFPEMVKRLRDSLDVVIRSFFGPNVLYFAMLQEEKVHGCTLVRELAARDDLILVLVQTQQKGCSCKRQSANQQVCAKCRANQILELISR